MNAKAIDNRFSCEYMMPADEAKIILLQFIQSIDMEDNTTEVFEVKVRCGLYFLNEYVEFANYQWQKGNVHASLAEQIIVSYENHGLFGIDPNYQYHDERIKECMDTVLEFLNGKNQSEMRLLMSVDFWNKPNTANERGGILIYVQDKIAKDNSNYVVSQDEIKKAINTISVLNTKKICCVPRAPSSEKST